MWPEYPRDACSFICEQVWEELGFPRFFYKMRYRGLWLMLESGFVDVGTSEIEPILRGHTWLRLEDVIIDPTASQFWGLPWMWIIRPGDEKYHRYQPEVRAYP
jgi:hypothetical protein